MSIVKKRLLIFSDWYYPGYKAGGPIKSVTNLSQALMKSYEVFVFTSDTDLNENLAYTNVELNTWVKPFTNSNVQVFYCSSKNLNSKFIKFIIGQVSPDYVYLNHMWSLWYVLQPLFICFYKFKKIKIVLCPRGALFESAMHYLNTYPKKILLLLVLKALRIHKKIIFHATSKLEKDTIIKYFGEVNIKIAHNLPDLHQPELCTIPKFNGILNLIFIARIVQIKNLKLLLDDLLKMKSAINLTIAGPIGDQYYWKSCVSIIDQMPKNIKISYIGEIAPNQIIPLLNCNHLYCLPTEGENFGHSIFESFIAGRPVLISNQTPWLDLDKSNAGWDVNIKIKNPLISFLEKAVKWQQKDFNLYCKGAWQLGFDYINNTTLISDYYLLFL